MGEWITTDEHMCEIVKRVTPEQHTGYTALDAFYWINFIGILFGITLRDVAFLLACIRAQVNVEQDITSQSSEINSSFNTNDQNRANYSEALAAAFNRSLAIFSD